MELREPRTERSTTDDTPRAAWPLGLALALGLIVRGLNLGQPIVENYVGRQIPTAMVARNLERGSGFTTPQIDTAPHPNYFVVEPPVYQEFVVGLRAVSGWPLDACGRLVSNLAVALGAWGVFMLVDRRAGRASAVAAAAAFSMLPITIRYGRAFQPDALMIGACAAGMACWDRSEPGRRCWTTAGWLLTTVGLGAKATSAFLLPAALISLFRDRRRQGLLIVLSTLIPVLLWYLWADRLISGGAGSRASADNRDVWMRLIGLGALARVETWSNITRFLVLRGFTPMGLIVAAWGFQPRPDRRRDDSLWRLWAGLGLATMAMVAGKLHHEYYWLCLAPVVAAGLGLAWSRIAERSVGLAWSAALGFGVLGLGFSASTWRTPDEWRTLDQAAAAVASSTPAGDWVVAPEPLLYQADRRGCRLEFTPADVARAAAEWGAGAKVGNALELVEFYRSRGARWVADVGAGADDARRLALHDGIRRRYKVWMDRPGFLLAELISDEPRGHAD